MGENFQYIFRRLLPFASLAVILVAILWLRPNAMSYFGFNLLLNLAAPIAFAALSQMFIIVASDIDLSTGPFVGLVTAIASTQLVSSPLLGLLGFAALIALYALAGFFGVVSGLMLAGTIQSGDALVAPEYTLLSIAAVILGGGEFVGGKVSPFGAVAGAATLVLVSVLLSFLQLPSDWQLGSQGFILLIVLSVRALLMKRSTGYAR